MPQISIFERTDFFEKNTTVLEVLQALQPELVPTTLGCFCGGLSLELTHPLTQNCTLYPITYQNEEGRRIYERSLRFVLLLAVRRILPTARVRIEHSVGYGIYAELLDHDTTEEEVESIEAEMRRIVQENLPFKKERWTRQQAIEYYKQDGETDKTRLLAYRPYDYFNVYLCGGMAEYFYGSMLPSTGYIKAFALKHLAPGFGVLTPSPKDPDHPAPYTERPKHLQAFAQSTEWCRILHCTNAADLNDLVSQNKLRDFIRVNEALHDRSLAEIASALQKRGARAIFIAGPSSSGKTTFANRLCIHLRVLGLSPVLISLDDFYRNKKDLPLEEDGEPDLEALSSLDVPHFRRCISALLNGQEVQMPRYDFTAGERFPVPVKMRLTESQPLVIEGIHGLNPELHHGFPKELLSTIYISELTCLNLDNHNRIRTTDARLLRRIVRDYQFRNTSPDETMNMWNSVRLGEEKWIFPYQEQADFVFNSALHYELPVLKNIAYPLLNEITPDNPNYLMSRRLLKILHYLLPAPEDALREIPPLSILREFIGGCTLYEDNK